MKLGIRACRTLFPGEFERDHVDVADKLGGRSSFDLSRHASHWKMGNSQSINYWERSEFCLPSLCQLLVPLLLADHTYVNPRQDKSRKRKKQIFGKKTNFLKKAVSLAKLQRLESQPFVVASCNL